MLAGQGQDSGVSSSAGGAVQQQNRELPELGVLGRSGWGIRRWKRWRRVCKGHGCSPDVIAANCSGGRSPASRCSVAKGQ